MLEQVPAPQCPGSMDLDRGVDDELCGLVANNLAMADRPASRSAPSS